MKHLVCFFFSSFQSILKLTNCWVKEQSAEIRVVEAQPLGFSCSGKGEELFPAQANKIRQT